MVLYALEVPGRYTTPNFLSIKIFSNSLKFAKFDSFELKIFTFSNHLTLKHGFFFYRERHFNFHNFEGSVAVKTVTTFVTLNKFSPLSCYKLYNFQRIIATVKINYDFEEIRSWETYIEIITLKVSAAETVRKFKALEKWDRINHSKLHSQILCSKFQTLKSLKSLQLKKKNQ